MSIQIPNLHTSNRSSGEGRATIFIHRRKDASHVGIFTVEGIIKFDPLTDDYPSANMRIRVDLSDSAKGVFKVTTVEQLDTMGKHTRPSTLQAVALSTAIPK